MFVLRALTCYHEFSLIIEDIEQALGTWPTTMPHFQTATSLGSLASSSLIVFLLPQGSILVFLPQGSILYHRGPYLFFYHRGPYSTTGVHTCFSTTGVHTCFPTTGVHTCFSTTGVHTCFPFWYDGLTCYLLSFLCCHTLRTVY